jgi:hypothetical protein
MSEALELINFHGAALEPHLDALGRLRIAVFREFPYLYEGSLEYEREYLQTYCKTNRSLVVLVFDGGEVVGATTCLPMVDEGPEFQEAFLKAGYDLKTICYFGESILLPPYRGRGMGKEFFPPSRGSRTKTRGAYHDILRRVSSARSSAPAGWLRASGCDVDEAGLHQTSRTAGDVLVERDRRSGGVAEDSDVLGEGDGRRWRPMMATNGETGNPPHPSPLPKGEGADGAAAPIGRIQLLGASGVSSCSLSLGERARVRGWGFDSTPAFAIGAALCSASALSGKLGFMIKLRA